MSQSITVLSVQQPFASLILSGIKVIENRSWSTPYRGRLYIHASGKPFMATQLSNYLPEDYDYNCDAGLPDLPGESGGYLLSGVILGSVELLGILPAYFPHKKDGKPRFDPDRNDCEIGKLFTAAGLTPPDDPTGYADFGSGTLHWILGRPEVLPTPIPAKGKLRLWEYTY